MAHSPASSLVTVQIQLTVGPKGKLVQASDVLRLFIVRLRLPSRVILFLASAGQAQLSIIHESNDNMSKARESRCTARERRKGKIVEEKMSK